MLIDKSGKLVTNLDFRGTKIEFLDKLTAKELFLLISTILQLVNRKESFTAKDLSPEDWNGTIYHPLFEACGEKKSDAGRLFGSIVKQALIMTPLLFRQESESEWTSVYVRI